MMMMMMMIIIIISIINHVLYDYHVHSHILLSRLLHTTNEKSYIIQDESTIERDYKVGDLIGQGSFASVWSATCLKTGKQFAMKSLLKHENQEWKKEVTMCRQVQDNPDTKTSKVMQIRDVYESREEAFIVSDLCLGGDLLDWMIDGPKKNVDEIRSLKMSENMLLAAESCHRAGLAHLDIKPENFCFRSEDSNSELVLVDFGSAEPFARAPYATTTGSYEKHLDDEVDLKRLVGMLAFSLALPFFVLLLCYNRFTLVAFTGTAKYISPECWDGRFSSRSDVWSIGVILYALLSNQLPFSIQEENELFKDPAKVKPFLRTQMETDNWSHVSDPVKSLVRNMLNPESGERASTTECLEMVNDLIHQLDI
jgi:serine/threonine protein kinase